MSIGLAYEAKALCSGVFVSHRDVAAIIENDLAIDELWFLKYFNGRAEVQKNLASASFLNLRREAVYRPGLGCTLTYGDQSLPSPQALEHHVAQDFVRSYAAALIPAIDWAFAEPDPQHLRRTRAVVILRHGEIIGERYAEGFGPDQPLPGWSMSKSVLNALVGILIREGKLHLDQPVLAPEWTVHADDPRRRITLKHLLQMSSGLEFAEDYGNPLQDVTYMLLNAPDAAVYAASKPLLHPPGNVLRYSSGTSNIISRLLRRAVGEADYPGFPKRALFDPLGMTHAVMEQDEAGSFVASSFLYATARDWARLGQLYLQDGLWQGRRILPPGWVKYSTTSLPKAPEGEYGAHFWLKIPESYRDPNRAISLPPDAFHAIGYEGQFITVLPSQHLVIVRLGLARHPHAWPHDAFIEKTVAALTR